MRYSLLLILFLSSIASSAEQVRTFDPKTQKLYAGIGSSTWWTDSPALCGVQLDSDCWGKFTAYVKESSDAAEFICSTLLAAKLAKKKVDFVMDVSSNSQCEIVQVVVE